MLALLFYTKASRYISRVLFTACEKFSDTVVHISTWIGTPSCDITPHFICTVPTINSHQILDNSTHFWQKQFLFYSLH